MPVARVQLPDGRIGRFEVPEGTTPEQVIAYAEQNLAARSEQQAAPRSTMQELGRQGGLAARYLAEGGAGLVGIAADPIGALLSKATGKPYQPLLQYVGDKLTEAELPQPETGLERVVGAASRGVAGGAGSASIARNVAPVLTGTAQRVAQVLAENPGAQLVGGAGAGAGGQGAAEAGGGAVSQLLASLAGGVVAPASMRVVPAAARGAKAVVEPFTKGGRENVVGSALNRASSEADSAAKAAAAQEIIAGSKPTTAQATRDIGLANLERGLRNSPEHGPRIAKRLAEQNDARADALDSIAKDEAAIIAAKGAREQATKPLYDAAKNEFAQGDETLKDLLSRPSLDKAWERAERIAAERGDRIVRGRDVPGGVEYVGGKTVEVRSGHGSKKVEQPGLLDAGGRPITRERQPEYAKYSGKALHYLKLALDDMIEGRDPDAAIGRTERAAMIDTKRELLDWMDEKLPSYGQARPIFAEMSKPINQMEALQKLRSNVQNAEHTPSGKPIISQAKFFRQFTQDRADLRKTMSRQQIELLERIARDLDRGAFSDTGGKAVGSPTIQNLSTAHFLGRMLGSGSTQNAMLSTAVRPLGWIMKIPNAQAEELLYDAMLDPQLAARLMRKPAAKDVEFINRELLKKYAAMTEGAGVGAVVSGPQERRQER